MTYPGDDAPKPRLARWMAAGAIEAGLPPELPVMAALVESGLANLGFGAADAAGFFQMRLSIWNHGEYAGFPERPGPSCCGSPTRRRRSATSTGTRTRPSATTR